MMSRKMLFIVTAALLVILGVGYLIVPNLLHMTWGIQPDEATIFMSRRWGLAVMGIALILWVSRDAPPSPARQAIIAGTFATALVTALSSLIGVVTGLLQPTGIAIALFEASLAVGFGYYLFVKPEAA